MESIKKSLYKTISWRVVATLGTVVIALLFTGKISISLGIGLVDGIIKTIFYYGHERVWANHK